MKSLTTVVLFISFFLCKAQLQNYSYYREIKPVQEDNYYNVKIPAAIIDRPGHYRIYELNEADTLEVPFINEYAYYNNLAQSSFRKLNIIDKSYEEGKGSYATVVIDTTAIYNSIVLNFASGNFFKDVTIEGSDDKKHWKTS